MAAILRYGEKKKQCRKGGGKRKRKGKREMEAESDMNYNTVLNNYSKLSVRKLNKGTFKHNVPNI